MRKLNAYLLLITGCAAMLSACRKTFDVPPPPGDPNLTATHTIRQLRAMHTVPGALDEITQDIIITGIVVANDKSGNLYKEIYIQDGSAGISLLIDAVGLYNSFPVGRRVFVRARGLTISDYNRLPQIGVRAVVAGNPSLQPIAANLIGQYIIGGSLNNPVAPKVVTLSQLTTNMQDTLLGTLIQLNNYEFIAADTAKTYADTSNYRNSVNLTVKGCTANSSIIVRSSGFANFAGVNVPNGNGNITAIYTLFGNTRQLIIRDTSDVQFNNPRCGQGPTTVINISALRSMYTGSTTAAPDGRRITGIVISDRTTNNENNQNLFLQQGNGLAGIVVRFDSPHAFNLGDSLDINVSQQELSEFNNLLQVNQVPLGYATRVATGKAVTPRDVTLAQLAANSETWEATLVRTGPVALSGGTGGTYSGNVIMNDGNTYTLRTSSSATFAGQPFPALANSVTGYVSQFGASYELHLRNPANDVVATGGGGGGIVLTTSPYTQNFDGIGGGLPAGILVKTGSTASSLGTDGVYTSTMAIWNATGGGFKNYASADGLTATSDATAQNASTDRALGVRQVSATDQGVAFVFQIPNTIGKTNFAIAFKLQSLDNTVGRTATWVVDYGIGSTPSSFTPVTTSPAGPLTTGPVFSNSPVSASFGSALNNQSQPVWIRVVVLSPTSGSGNRPSSAIDDVTITWN
ncbi:MAG TPA: DUF5689 domain-containing protein [Chitinophagaceae bacterium]|nr:DUF5689 domain-containing protein [Chitinophagaceae bacterium]